MLGGEAESPRYFLSFAARLGGRMEVGAGRGGQGCRRGQKVEEYETDGVWCEGQ